MTEFTQHFEDTIRGANGRMVDDARNAPNGFICAVLPIESPIQPGDILTGGVAIKREGKSLQLYTYLLREICTNGAIMPLLENEESFTEGQLFEFKNSLAKGIDRLKSDTLTQKAQQFRLSLFQRVEERRLGWIAAQLVAITQHRGVSRRFIQLMHEERRRPLPVKRMQPGRHPRRFDVINAVTALARDTDDPDTRWQLMKFGGSLLVGTVEKDPSEQALHTPVAASW